MGVEVVVAVAPVVADCGVLSSDERKGLVAQRTGLQVRLLGW